MRNSVISNYGRWEINRKSVKNIRETSKDIYDTEEYTLSNKYIRELNNLIIEIKKGSPNVKYGFSDGGFNATVIIDSIRYKTMYFPMWYFKGNQEDPLKRRVNESVLNLLYVILEKYPVSGVGGKVPQYYLNYLE